MKREAVKNPVVEVTPLFFWRECVACGLEYRREPMWRRTNDGFFGTYYSHCCKTCAPDKNSAIKAFNR